MKQKLTIELLKKAAKVFCAQESTYNNKQLYGVTDGKAVETFIEHKFQDYLEEHTPTTKARLLRVLTCQETIFRLI